MVTWGAGARVGDPAQPMVPAMVCSVLPSLASKQHRLDITTNRSQYVILSTKSLVKWVTQHIELYPFVKIDRNIIRKETEMCTL